MQIFDQLKRLLKAYFITSLICYALDIIEFIIQLVRFGRIGDVRILLFANLLLLGIFRIGNDGLDSNVPCDGFLLCVLDISGKEEISKIHLCIY